MKRWIGLLLMMAMPAVAADLPTRKVLSLDAVKVMVAASEAKALELHVTVTLCLVDASENLIFLERPEGAALNTLGFCQKKAKDAAYYGEPSKAAEDTVKQGHTEALAYPEFFPNQGGVPVLVDGPVLGGYAASGARSEIDEEIAKAGLEALAKWLKR
jgi:glc operon protein GlcG